MRTAVILMILAPLKPFIREAPLPEVVKTLAMAILSLLPVRSTATYNHTMFDTRRLPCEKGQSLVLTISMLDQDPVSISKPPRSRQIAHRIPIMGWHGSQEPRRLGAIRLR